MLPPVQTQAKKVFKNTVKHVEQSVENQVKETFHSTKDQFIPKDHIQTDNKNHPSHELTREVVEDFYAPSNPQAQQMLEGQSLPKAGEMTPEEQASYQKLRKQLHEQVYYGKLLERKSQEQEHIEDEHQEEQEKQMEELQMEEKKKQDDDIAIRMQTNRAEQFPGMAG